ncbi:hypothetical protein [Avibacterium paragallinarum]|uniref:hypothetical protein n=1 Tax=Avibacterium TaxID=292486 RepID=UPI002ED82AAA
MFIYVIGMGIVAFFCYLHAKKQGEEREYLEELHKDYLMQMHIRTNSKTGSNEKINVEHKTIKTQRDIDFDEAIKKLYSYGTGYDYYGQPFYDGDDYERLITGASKETAMRYIKAFSLKYFRYKGITNLTAKEHSDIDIVVERIYNLIKYHDCRGPGRGF